MMSLKKRIKALEKALENHRKFFVLKEPDWALKDAERLPYSVNGKGMTEEEFRNWEKMLGPEDEVLIIVVG